MSTEQTTTPDVTVTDDLDLFASELFGESAKPSDDAKSEKVEDVTEESDDAPTNDEEVDTQSDETGEDDTPAPDDDEDNETVQAAKPEKKNRLQDRINELTAARRQEEREKLEAIRERDELRAKLEEKQTPKPTEQAKATDTVQEGPKPGDKNEDGTDKYPLGEFDPKFVKDTIQHALAEERKALESQKAEQEKLSAEDQYRATLQNSWNEKLEDVRERYPDYEDKGQQMLDVFSNIDPNYGQYLVDTLMELDARPEVFYYLANNLDEAEEIVNAGPRKATIAFAKLEAQLAGTKTTNKTPAVKVTKAPAPPPQLKGSAVSKASVPLDTDDLDAFSKQLFKKK